MLGEVRCSGRYGVTEFFSEREITFTSLQAWSVHIADVVIAEIAILKTGSDLVK